MIYNNEHYFLLGMHGDWGIFILVVVILIVVWVCGPEKENEQYFVAQVCRIPIAHFQQGDPVKFQVES